MAMRHRPHPTSTRPSFVRVKFLFLVLLPGLATSALYESVERSSR